jgi:Ala-tRNA(Pro) deacylase
LDVLGVVPGSVTPFALLNDTARRVTFFLDADLAGAAHLNFHPLENTATTTVSADGLRSFLRSTGHDLNVVDLRTG